MVVRHEMEKRGEITPWRGSKKPDADTYIIKAVITNRFKVGVSYQVGHRLYSMQGVSPDELKLVFTLPGHKWEKILHDRLKKHRVHGEWFDLNDDSRAIVTGVLAEAGVAH